MNYYKATIQYQGTNYAGFQWQNGLPTVQSEFNNALAKLVFGKVTTMAASRTDTGVHAIEQIVKVSSENLIDITSFKKSFNEILPSDIRCTAIDSCAGLFRPSTESVSKEYRYFFTNKVQPSSPSSNERQFVSNISNQLNIDAMIVCTQILIGEHDFCNFYSSGSNVKSTIRTISLCELTIINPHDIFSNIDLFSIPSDLTSCHQLRIEANGFLKQMIRHIVSALWMVGTGKLSIDEFQALLDGVKSERQWRVAPPNGLFLFKINYS